jgi:osmotically inducible protein OsmC
MNMVRKASAIWKGTLKEGKGTLSSGSGLLKDVPYDFGKRFEDQPGTNPEELIAAAQASCYAMALSANLGKADLKPESVDAKATLKFEKTDAGFTTTGIHLEVLAKVPGVSNEVFQKSVEEARKTCPIARLLNTTLTVDAKLA